MFNKQLLLLFIFASVGVAITTNGKVQSPKSRVTTENFAQRRTVTLACSF